MNIEITYDNGRHYQTTSLDKTTTRKIADLILNEFEQKDGSNPKTRKLLFAGDEWNVPNEIVDEVYKDIVLSYCSNKNKSKQQNFSKVNKHE